ncbi:MAG: LysM domain-containing protein [Ferruginibacter sp.]
MYTHYVQKGETMDGIARRYGLPNGTAVFYASCNARLKVLRSKPEKIREGDLVNIPDNAVILTEKKLLHLRKIRAEYLAMNEKILSEWNYEYNKVNRVANQADMAATVALILVDLGKIVHEGVKTMKLSGSALEAANRSLGKSAIDFGYSPIESIVEEGVAESFGTVQPTDGLATSIGKRVLHFLLVDWSTPSFWASKWTGVDIKETNHKVVSEIETQKSNMLKRLDAQISATELNLLKLKRVYSGGAPALY